MKNRLFRKKEIQRPKPVTGTQGLTEEEVDLRNSLHLTNKVTQKVSDSYLKIILKNLFSWFNIILFAVAIGFMALGIGTSSDSQYGISKYGFLIPVLINLFIGTFQECRAKKIIDQLSLVTSAKVKALRDGKWAEIMAEDIVLDDLLQAESGIQFPVDAEILSGALDVDESILTGEQKDKRRLPGETLFAGALIVSGTALVRVKAVGNETYSQKLKEGILKTKKPKAEMIKVIDRFVLALSILIVPLAFLSGWSSYNSLNGFADPTYLFQDVTVSVGTTIVGAIPTGMVLLASARCALSVIALYKENTSVKELRSVEGLAQSQIVCLDKTGTLTTGKMQFAGADYLGNNPQRAAIVIGALIHNVPDSSETAAAIRREYPWDGRLKAKDVIPFNSKIKHSGCVFESDPNHFYGLGAPQFLLPQDSSLLKKVSEKAAQGIRVLAFVRKDIDGSNPFPLALIFLKDEIRPSSFDVIKRLTESGVKVRIISGDDPGTVSAIAKRLSVPNAELAVNMKNISTPEEINDAASRYVVFGRATPEQKQLLIKSMQQGGEKVTMVIDALNDILAAKTADCSICIAHEGGSAAATQVADVTILDGDFSHMPAIIKEGRKSVNDMLRSSTLFLMKSFLALGLAATSPIFGHIPYSVEGLYLVTWFVTGVGGFILGLEDSDEPVSPHFGKRVLARALPAGLFLFLSVFAVELMVKFGAMPYAVVHPHLGNDTVFPPTLGPIGTGLSYAQYLEALGEAGGDKASLLASLLFVEEPVCILAAVIAAFTVMMKVCQPFTKFRLTALGICAFITIGATLIFPVYFLGADNTPNSQRFDFEPFWSENTYFAVIGGIPSAWIYLVALAVGSVFIYWLISNLAEVSIFHVRGSFSKLIAFSDWRKDDSLRQSLYNLFGKKRRPKSNDTEDRPHKH